ncbi:MAG: hypothetical protein AB7F88_09645 [Pyrinomonadaceae bacterium]
MKKDILFPLIILMGISLGCSKIGEFASGPANSGNASDSNTETAKSGETVPAAGEFAPTSDPKADIEKIADRFMSRSFFTAKMELVGDATVRTDLEFISPDRYRLRTDGLMEMIIVGKNSYMKTGGKWRKMPLQIGSTVEDMRAAFSRDGMKWFSDVRYAGDDTIDGRPAFVYAYHSKGPTSRGENDSKLWVGSSDGLPIKIEAIYTSGEAKSMTIEYDYETPVSIEPPIE